MMMIDDDDIGYDSNNGYIMIPKRIRIKKRMLNNDKEYDGDK